MHLTGSRLLLHHLSHQSLDGITVNRLTDSNQLSATQNRLPTFRQIHHTLKLFIASVSFTTLPNRLLHPLPSQRLRIRVLTREHILDTPKQRLLPTVCNLSRFPCTSLSHPTHHTSSNLIQNPVSLLTRRSTPLPPLLRRIPSSRRPITTERRFSNRIGRHLHLNPSRRTTNRKPTNLPLLHHLPSPRLPLHPKKHRPRRISHLFRLTRLLHPDTHRHRKRHRLQPLTSNNVPIVLQPDVTVTRPHILPQRLLQLVSIRPLAMSVITIRDVPRSEREPMLRISLMQQLSLLIGFHHHTNRTLNLLRIIFRHHLVNSILHILRQLIPSNLTLSPPSSQIQIHLHRVRSNRINRLLHRSQNLCRPTLTSVTTPSRPRNTPSRRVTIRPLRKTFALLIHLMPSQKRVHPLDSFQRN